MRALTYILTKALFLFLVIILDVFFQGLLLPLGLVEVVNITILNLFFLYSFEKVLPFALILGVLKDYGEGMPLGMHSVIYGMLCVILTLLKLTIISYENKTAITIGVLIFNTLYIFAVFVILNFPVSFK